MIRKNNELAANAQKINEPDICAEGEKYTCIGSIFNYFCVVVGAIVMLAGLYCKRCIMRKLLFILLMLLPVVAFCDRKKQPLKIPRSRWREVKRMGLDSSVINFADTFYIAFKAKDTMSYHYQNGFIYNGTYTINEDSILELGTARFRIAMKRPTNLVFVDEKHMYVLEPDKSDTGALIILPTAEKIDTITSIDQMIGKWTVYKRTTKEQGESLDNAVAIRTIYITGPSTDGKQGFIYSGKDPSDKPSWFVKNLGTDLSLDCDGKNPRILKVVKCQNGEMILEENDITYYFKQFK